MDLRDGNETSERVTATDRLVGDKSRFMFVSCRVLLLMALRPMLVVSTLLLLTHPATSQTANSSLQISPVAITFPAQSVGSQSAPITVTVSSPAASSIRIDQVLSSGIDFNTKNKCGRELAAGNSCTIEVTFKPAVSGERMGILEVLSSDTASPHFISLSGIGE